MIVAQRVADGEAPLVGLDLRQEDALEEQVADLAAQRVVIGAVDRVEHLVGFFEHERPQRLNRLLAIPRAAAGPAQPRHDVDEALELAPGRARARRALVRIGACATRVLCDALRRRTSLAMWGLC